ncbi:MAG: peptidoglycan binding domain-containing protein, partial [Anaerolineales bacterium]|nr:peptidoglycan binding domain-containing protein [Anaerolineales bacterium]
MKTWDATPSSLSLGPLPNSRTSLRIQLIRAWSLLLLAVLSFSIPPILLAVGSYVYFQSSGRILPGVRAGELELGGKTIEEAMRVIDAEWNLENEIVVFDLDDPGRRWVDQASSFGLVVDAAATASRAFEQGREGRGLESIVRLLDVLHAGVVIENVVSIDAVKAKSRLEAWAAQVGIPPVEAQVALEGRTIVAQSAQDGKTVDVLASLNLLIEDPAAIRIEHQMLPLVTVPIPSRSIASQAAIETLEHMLQVDASLRVYDPVTDEHFSWSPGDAEFAEWVEIKPENGEFKVALRPDRMRAFVEGMTSSLGEQRAIDVDQAVATLMSSFAADAVGPLFVHYRPGSYVVRPGDTLISISFKVGMPYWKLNEVN